MTSPDYERGYQDGVRAALECAKETCRRRVPRYIDRVTGTRCADTVRPQHKENHNG